MNSMKQANENFDKWRDAQDVYKALSDFVMEKNRTLPMHDADWLEFAQYFAKRCGVVLDGNSEIQNNHMHCPEGHVNMKKTYSGTV